MTGMRPALTFTFVLASMTAGAEDQSAGGDNDWPFWRRDAAHTGTTPRALADRLHLQWTRELPSLEPGWPDQPKVQMDAVYEPVVLGRMMFVPSSRADSVTALDTRTGEKRWTFFCDGPVRTVPAAWEGRVYVASDEGFLYCLDAEKGGVLWKFRGGPADRRILGNGRLISTWPARGAPVVADGVVYFGAGIWPFMGIFLHALDARTGAVIWTNEGDGSTYMLQPHSTDSFAGVAPQGPMTVIGNNLLVSGGRSVPACYDRKTGKLKYFKYADNGRRGGADVAAVGNLYFAGGMAYDLATGLYIGEFSRPLAAVDDLFCYAGKSKDLLLAKPPGMTVVETVDRKGAKILRNQWKMGPPETVESPLVTALLRAGRRVYAGSEGRITAFQLGPKTKEAWRLEIEGTPASLLAADDRLFVVTREGMIHCFGAARQERIVHDWKPIPKEKEYPPTPLGDGYGVYIGEADPGHLAGLSAQPLAQLLVFDDHAERVDRARRELESWGIYGVRAAVYRGDASSPLPPYLATTIRVDSGPLAPATVRRLYDSLRPYGGKLLVRKDLAAKNDLDQWISDGGLPGAKLAESETHLVLSREGPLPGAGNWTHEHADAANTRVSKDSIVRAPLGLLWFGGPSHEGILPRHGHGPQPHVIDGRLIIEGVDKVRATDIYTGRLLWEASLPGVGDFFNNVIHQPGANGSGSNIVSTSDGIYVAWKKKCVRLDPATGKVLSEFEVPGGTSDWTCLSLSGDYLIGGAEPTVEMTIPKQTQGGFDADPLAVIPAEIKKLMSFRPDNDSRSSSYRIFVLDRTSGKVLWQASARAGFRHNSICVGGGRLYVIDRLSGPQVDRMKKEGRTSTTPPLLLAFDLRDGRELWRSEDGIFGTFLSYSQSRDVLVEAGRVARDTIKDEPKGMRAWRAAEGKVIWKKDYSGPGMIHGDTILCGEIRACDLMTGAPRGRIHPITGQAVEWTWARNYGCNTPAASEHLMTFRSGAAGYFDLAGDGGTGNLGGFKSGCTNNLIVAGGLLNAPDYTRTCICSYQNQASLALVPDPDAEMWTFFGTTEIKGPIKRIGVNLGAPGDRRAENGTLWVEHPSVGGKSPAAPVALDGPVERFRKHSSRIGGNGIPWVSSSGMKGLTSLTLTLDKAAKEEQPYTVRLHFVEPDGLAPGQRLFDVMLQGQEVLKNFDICREAGGVDRALVKEFTVAASTELKLKFVPRKGSTLLCGLEVVAGGEIPPAVSVVHTELTVPESMVSLRTPAEEAKAVADDSVSLHSFLWVAAGATIFMYLFYRLHLLSRRAA
jgi:outer membrane protein assembly factor BamB